MQTNENVICPWCGAPFTIAPGSSAASFVCPRCGHPSSLGTLRQKQRPANAEKISGPAALGVGDHLSRFTVNYRFINKKGEENFATGVLVNFEGRLLLATVAHARPRSLSDIFIIKKLTSSSITPLEPYDCVTRREADPARDVAFFELQPDASSVIGADAIGADKIFDAGTGREHKTFLVGFPSELAAPHVPFEAR